MELEKKQRIYKTIMLIILVSIITFVATTILMYRYMEKEEGTKYVLVSGTEDETGIANTLKTFRSIINNKYLGDINQDDLKNGAIKGYIAGLGDPYTEYYTKDEMEEISIATMGNYVGIGIYMTKNVVDNTIVILSPIEDSPAEKAGILPGDVISKIDNVSYTGDEMSIASAKIKGKEGEKIELEIKRGEQILNFSVERQSIKINHVESEMLENNIGYLRLKTFDEGCSDEFKQKLEELKSQNIKSLIIDIRNNGGGIVDEALEILDLLLAKNLTTLITVDKDNNEEISNTKNETIIDVPIVVLTNENTASASEILAGALKDHKRATIVGDKTYGKGVIQQLMTLSDGSGLKITTNEYYTPNRNKINEVGIIPDNEISLPEELKSKTSIDKKEDTQLQKAIEILK